MAKVADEILINIKVNKAGADREVRQWQATYNKSMDSIGSKTDQIEAKIKRSSNAIGGHLRTLAATLAAGVSVTAISNLLDKYTQLENRLKVAGLSGAALAGVQERLFETANKNGTAVNGLAELYSRMALSQKELGATTEEMLQVTAGVSAALRVQGLSAEQAAGPLLQLAQAMGGGIVRAEEFNSMVEGMPALVLAAAKHIDGANGSLSKLRALMIDGKITSEAWFQAMLKGLPEIESQAANAALTIGQSMEVLRNELIKYAGQVDASFGVSEKFVAILTLLSQNIDKIAPAVAVIAAVIGGRFLAGMIAGTAATVNQALAFERAGGAALAAAARYDKLTVSEARFLTATDLAAASAGLAAGQLTRLQIAAGAASSLLTKAGSSILSVFGGPIGLAITGVSIALMSLTSESMEADANVAALAATIQSADATIAKYSSKADQAASAAAGVGNEANVAAPKIDAFAGAVGRAAQQLWEMARAKQAAALAELTGQRREIIDQTNEAQRRQRGNRRSEMANELTGGATTFENGWKVGMRFFVGEIKDIWTGGQYSRDQDNTVRTGIEAIGRLDAAIKEAQGNLEQFADPNDIRTPPATGGSGGSKAKSGGSGAGEARRLANEAERAQREALQRQRAMEDDLYRLGDAMLQTMMERENTAAEQLELELEGLKRDRDANSRAIDREVIDGDKTAAEAATLKELEEAVYNERVANANRKGQQAIREEQMRAEQELLDMQMEMLQIAAGNARSQREARAIQLQILEAQQKQARDALEERIKTDPGLRARAPELRADLEKLEKAQTENVIRNTMEPLQAWFDQSMMTADQVREAYQQVAVDGLNRLSDGLVDIVTGTKTAKEAFADMARSILADLARIAIKRFVTQVGAQILGFNEGGEVPAYADGGLIRGPGTGTSDSINAKVSAGEYIVKEKQTKKYKALLDAINNDKVPGFAGGGMVGRAGSIPSGMLAQPVQNFYVDAKGSVLANDLMEGMQQVGAQQAGQAGLGAVAYTQGKSQRASVRNRQRFV